MGSTLSSALRWDEQTPHKTRLHSQHQPCAAPFQSPSSGMCRLRTQREAFGYHMPCLSQFWQKSSCSTWVGDRGMSWRGWGAQGAPRPLCSLPLSLPHCSYFPAHGHAHKAQAGFHRGLPYPTGQAHRMRRIASGRSFCPHLSFCCCYRLASSQSSEREPSLLLPKFIIYNLRD